MRDDGSQHAVIRPDWVLPAGVQAALTTRAVAEGVSAPPFDRFNLGGRCGDEPRAVATNRSALAELLGVRQPILWLHQVHGTDVVDAGHWNGRDEPRADAAVAHQPGVALAVLTADCLPILLCSTDGEHIAAVHAGWRGLAAGVIERSVQAMACDASALTAWLGPCIGSVSYEVGMEVRNAFLAHDPAAAPSFTPTRPGHWQCNLEQLARLRLAAAGVPVVVGGGWDTFTDPRFYSYRRTPVTGRFASLIWRD